MTLQECYAAMGGNFDDVIGRLRSEKLVQKFVLKFLNDDSYELLNNSIESGNYTEAFRAAHTIKGVCQNLSFVRLQDSSARLTEALRDGNWNDEVAALVEEVRGDYQATADAIRTLAGQ